jgi:hypothetical protein
MTQTARLLQLLKNYKPHNTVEILREVYGSEHLGIARIGARIADLYVREKKTITLMDAPRKSNRNYAPNGP